MYSRRHGLVFGFHGCDKSVALNVVHDKEPLKPSENDYDWLGHGIYFWEGSVGRAMQFAEESKKRGAQPGKTPIQTPYVLGAVINLGRCLDLLESESLRKISIAYDVLNQYSTLRGIDLPKNSLGPDRLMRKLDCAVIEVLHEILDERPGEDQYYDSVKGVFTEGKPLYKDAGFHEKDHIQLCIRNPNCIKGFFIPREVNTEFREI